MKSTHFLAVAIVLLVGFGAQGSVQLFGPTPYFSQADIPVGLYAGGSPTFLEDFEDSSLGGGITASNGGVIPPYSGGEEPYIDSVDGDDGVLDGWGLDGHSWFYTNGAAGVTFTFADPVTAAGIVWTDGDGTTTFEAFRGATSIGIIGPVTIATPGSYGGQADSDRFFGIADPLGITAVKLSNTRAGIEVDHVQYGEMVPEPATLIIWSLLGTLAVGLGWYRRRKMA